MKLTSMHDQDWLFAMMQAEIGNAPHQEVTGLAFPLASYHNSCNSKSFCPLTHYVPYGVCINF